MQNKMKKRISWRKEYVSELSARYGFSQRQSEMWYERVYRQALHKARKRGVTSAINISRELYASTFWGGTQLFDVTIDDIAPKAKVSQFFEGKDLEFEFTKARFQNMANKYEDIQNLLDQLEGGELNYDEFRDQVEEFRLTNSEYLKAGS